jgi:hypothetical protein
MLCSPNQPAEVRAYSIWFVSVEAPAEVAMAATEPAGADAVRILQSEIDQRYPGIRTASRAEKKRFGARLLTDAFAGRLVERCKVPEPSDIVLARGIYLASGPQRAVR